MKKYKYEIKISKVPKSWKLKNNNKVWLVNCNKNYGDFYSGGASFKNKRNEILSYILGFILEWKKYDSILKRMPDPITDKNLFLLCPKILKIKINDVLL